MTTINFVAKFAKKFLTKKNDDDEMLKTTTIIETYDDLANIKKLSTKNFRDTRVDMKLTNEKMFVKNFHDVDVTIDLTMINNKTLSSDEFIKNFRFDITIAKFCLTKRFDEMIR